MTHEDVPREDVGPAVRWEHIGQQRFDRLVEALVFRQHGRSAQVQPVDGRGGDDGVDILVLENDRRTILQLKYFPEGFDGRFRDRRQQIKKSLDQALAKNDFDEWVLVMPGIPTKSGWAWWGKLTKQHPDLRMRLVTRIQLDDWCARDSDIVDSLHGRDYVLQKAAVLSQEKAVLAGGFADLTDRVAALGEVVDDVDPAWTLDFARRGNTVVHTLRAKNTLAASLHPISVHVGVAGDAEDPQLRAFDRALRYGTFEAVTVRGDLIQNFEVTGSRLVATEAIPDFFEIDRVADGAEPSVLSLRFLDASGKSMGVHRGKVEQVAGSGGGRIRQRFYDRLTVTWTLDFEDTSTVDVEIELDALLEQEVGNAKRLGQLLLAWCAGSRLSLELPDGTPLARMTGTLPEEVMPPESLESLRVMLEIAEDLEFVQAQLGEYFPMPDQFTGGDRIRLRMLRRAFEGRQTCDPRISQVTATLDPRFLETEDSQALLDGESRLMLFHRKDLVFPVAGHDLAVDGAYLFDQGRVALTSEDQSTLREGNPVPVTVANTDGRHAIFYMPSRTPPGTPVGPEPWGLRGIPELSQFGAPRSAT